MRYFYVCISVIVFIFLLAFASFNDGIVTVKYFWFAQSTTLSVVILVALLSGVALTLLALLASQIRYRREIIQLKRELKNKNQLLERYAQPKSSMPASVVDIDDTLM